MLFCIVTGQMHLKKRVQSVVFVGILLEKMRKKRNFAPNMKIKAVVEALENFAPLPLQEGYDNAGLQCGLTERNCSGALLCLDVTEEVIAAAAESGCNLIVSHHPLLFRGLKCIADEGYVERCVRRAILSDVAIYSAHTNLDNAFGGVCHEMAQRLGLTDVEFLVPSADGRSGSGVVGNIAPVPASELLVRMKDVFGAGSVAYSEGPQQTIRHVALCGGSGDFLIDAACRQGADLFVTGEIGYHRFFGYGRRMWLASIGHFESERYTPHLMERILQDALPGLRTVVYEAPTSPVRYL